MNMKMLQSTTFRITSFEMDNFLRSLRSEKVLSSEFAKAEDKRDKGSNCHKYRQQKE